MMGEVGRGDHNHGSHVVYTTGPPYEYIPRMDRMIGRTGVSNPTVMYPYARDPRRGPVVYVTYVDTWTPRRHDDATDSPAH